MNPRHLAGSIRNAQSAMEFLMTYGWAILTLAIVVGALVELGAFGSANASPNSCIASGATVGKV